MTTLNYAVAICSEAYRLAYCLAADFQSCDCAIATCCICRQTAGWRYSSAARRAHSPLTATLTSPILELNFASILKMHRKTRPLVLLAFFLCLSSPTLAQTVFSDGFEESCLLDNDNDRLVNCQEAALGTGIDNPDTDGDGLRDGDEVLGTLAGLSLPEMGVNPLRKDILIEHDWSEDSNECGTHHHKPSIEVLNQLSRIFATAPVSNPNGQLGINLIHDIGQGGVFSGGNQISIPDGSLQGNIFGPDFPTYKSGNFAGNRLGYFHYAIHAHQYTDAPFSSGSAEIAGDDLLVTLQCFTLSNYIRNTTMHELGHNLGLLHGGNTFCNRKPNYNSLMNYRYQFNGVDSNCDRYGDGQTNYSTGTRITIDENIVDESIGVCGSPAIDWNGNGTIENGIQVDINDGELFGCGGQFSILSDFNDWANLIFSTLPGAPGGGAPPGSIECQNTPTP